MVFVEAAAASFQKDHPLNKNITNRREDEVERKTNTTRGIEAGAAAAVALISLSVFNERLDSETRLQNCTGATTVNSIDFWQHVTDTNNYYNMVSASSHIASDEFWEKCCPKDQEVVKCQMNLETEGAKHEHVKLIIELYPKKLPKACTNFLALCHGGLSLHGRKMQYKDSILHEIVPDWCVVGGDFLNGNGSGGRSIFDGNKFEDETFDAVDYNQDGLLCNLSHGPNTNTSIFFITLKPAEWIKGLYEAFGKVVEGLDNLKALAKEVGSPGGVPTKKVKITSCGLL